MSVLPKTLSAQELLNALQVLVQSGNGKCLVSVVREGGEQPMQSVTTLFCYNGVVCLVTR